MSFKRTGLGQPCSTLAKTAVKCALRNALRPYLKHDIPFFALFVVPDADAFPIYEAAASALLVKNRDQFRRADRTLVDSMKTPFKGGQHQLTEALKSHQAVIFVQNLEDIPSSAIASADFVINLEPPSARHFQIAALHYGFKGMTETDAEFLASAPLRDVDAAVRSRRPLPNALRRLRQLSAFKSELLAVRREEGRESRTLENMSGLGHAREWGLRLAADVRDWKAHKLRWDDIDRGALISGAPGCGKTSFVKALAASCDLPIVLGSASRWQATGHLGVYLKAMRQTFADARAKAPCILFLDEFDSFGSREALSAGADHADYRRQTINGLLECLDPSEGREGIIVVGATNYPEKVDPALLRPGRLETVIQIPLLDWQSRIAILHQYLGSFSTETDWTEFAMASEGMTGADLEKVAREVRREARRAGTTLPSEQQVLRLLPPVTIFSDEERRRIAVHEIGHAIVGALLLPDRLTEVLIRDRRPTAAKNLILGGAQFCSVQSPNPTADHILDRIATALAGIAAERIIYGNHGAGCGGTATSDLGKATEMAFHLEYETGLANSLLYIDGRDADNRQRLLALRGDMQVRVEAVLQKQLQRAEDMLQLQKRSLVTLAVALAARLTISGDEVRAELELGRDEHRRAAP